MARLELYAAATVAGFMASTWCSELLAGEADASVEKFFPTYIHRFFSPNDDCQNARLDIVLENGTARITFQDLEYRDGRALMTGQGGREGSTLFLGGPTCKVAVQVSPVK
jgi:hypothetical protein